MGEYPVLKDIYADADCINKLSFSPEEHILLCFDKDWNSIQALEEVVITPEVEEEVETTQPATPKTSKMMYQGNIYILRGNEVYTLTGNRVK